MAGRPLTTEQITRLQQALADHGFQPGPVDGIDGPQTNRAIINARIAYKLDHQDQALYDVALERELGLLVIQDPIIVAAAKARGIDLLTLIGLIGPISNLLKGKTVTADQITGILRAILAAIFGYITGKGWLDANTAATISGAVLTLIVTAWSIYSNRAKTIVPISAK